MNLNPFSFQTFDQPVLNELKLEGWLERFLLHLLNQNLAGEYYSKSLLKSLGILRFAQIDSALNSLDLSGRWTRRFDF
jgi:hypothetical protein